MMTPGFVASAGLKLMTLFEILSPFAVLEPNTPAETLIEISKKMGHSITQQMLYRWTTTPDS